MMLEAVVIGLEGTWGGANPGVNTLVNVLKLIFSDNNWESSEKMTGKKPSIRDVIDEIVTINRSIAKFWSRSHGWAPNKGAEILSKSRLDRQVSLSACLRMWLKKPPDDQKDGHLILAWANLGTLIEGSMKFFLCVFEHDYTSNPVMDRRKNAVDPDGLMLDTLRKFFLSKVWTDKQGKRWGPFVETVQQRRNGIHAYKHRELGHREDFEEAVRNYLEFLEEINATVPYPDLDEYR